MFFSARARIASGSWRDHREGDDGDDNLLALFPR
jgi:hypothetical protein